ncbi:hypothetical protein [Anaerosacchariphilus polymeriproducens]|uniref:Uncharacterized protein n=1 Tax=Anaerosacchariphilus polymeriproducens TaxID=1812858 RepID=A0A371ATJ2_9FIRM|nr:hypothetical protein [Anaerosacchariphilus polymeriproducens]RDU22862.1 hypothetical protein DWV06_12525 [Anaerosacchariphilus polymeriproducens]
MNEILKSIEKEIFQTARTVSVNGSTYVSFNDIRVIMHIYATDKDVGIKTRGDIIRESNESLAIYIESVISIVSDEDAINKEEILEYLNQVEEE